MLKMASRHACPDSLHWKLPARTPTRQRSGPVGARVLEAAPDPLAVPPHGQVVAEDGELGWLGGVQAV